MKRWRSGVACVIDALLLSLSLSLTLNSALKVV